jgi:anti-anti-sigma factor
MPGMMLEVGIETQGRVNIVTVKGPIDSATYEQFRQPVDTLTLNDGVYILVDCAGLTYVNSKGIGLLTSYHRKCFATRGWFGLCNVNRKIVKTMDLLGLGSFLIFYPTKEEGLKAMQALPGS